MEEKEPKDRIDKSTLMKSIIDESMEMSFSGGKEEDCKWYMVHVQSGKEFVVKASLEARLEEDGYKDVRNVLVPVYSETIYKNGKKKKVEKRSFPGYICVQMFYSLKARAYVQETPYISGFVSRGKEEPQPLTEKEINVIITKKEDSSQEVQTVQIDFDVGQKVLIVDGPFNNFSGTIESISPDKGKISVNIEIFGRQTPVEIDYYKVKKQ